MQAAKLIESRTQQWRQLEQLCTQLESRRTERKLDARRRVEFAALYRSACADLALADAHQLPAGTVRYLHQLVGRAHNQLYRTHNAIPGDWRERVFRTLPRQLLADGAVRLAAALFWLPFLASMLLASRYTQVPEFAETVVGREYLEGMAESHSQPFEERNGWGGGFGTGFYIHHNATIGLRCFVMGLAFGVGGMFETFFNAVTLGAVFGHMTTVSNNQYFFEFVTAHGPFELTAIVLAAAAGMKMGFALVDTGGLTRTEALRKSARDALPILYAAVTLFVFAAFIEGFLSPSAAPYELKAFVGMASTLALLWYFVALGYAQGDADEPVAGADTQTSPFASLPPNA